MFKVFLLYDMLIVSKSYNFTLLSWLYNLQK